MLNYLYTHPIFILLREKMFDEIERGFGYRRYVNEMNFFDSNWFRFLKFNQ